MHPEPAALAEILEERRHSAQETIREISNDELRALLEELFPDGTHPWLEVCTRFIDEHRGERALRGETSDGYSFIYYPLAHRGLWYRHVGSLHGVGIIGDRALKVLAEISLGHL